MEINEATGRYTERRGNVLERVFQGEAKINGQPVDFSQWPMIESPWVKQPRGGPLVISDDHERRIYDFDKWRIEVNS